MENEWTWHSMTINLWRLLWIWAGAPCFGQTQDCEHWMDVGIPFSNYATLILQEWDDDEILVCCSGILKSKQQVKDLKGLKGPWEKTLGIWQFWYVWSLLNHVWIMVDPVWPARWWRPLSPIESLGEEQHPEPAALLVHWQLPVTQVQGDDAAGFVWKQGIPMISLLGDIRLPNAPMFLGDWGDLTWDLPQAVSQWGF